MDYLKQDLQRLERDKLLRQLKLVEGPQEAKIVIDGKVLINLCSNNYLGLCNDKRLKASTIGAVKSYGLGSGASRLISGNMFLHRALENKVACFKKTEAALVFNSGYCANLGVISSLVGKDDIVFSDKLNHASLIDGVILSRAKCRRYPHKDTAMLETFLKQSLCFKRRLIVTDTVFSMDGDLAPLLEIVGLARKYDCLLFVDEAHATGVLGKTGRGALEYFSIDDDNIIQMGTLSKAVGSFGAYVCGRKSLIDYLINKARAFIYTTALPVSICAASLAGLDIIKDDYSLRRNLNKNITFLRAGLGSLGFKISDSPTPILPLLIGDNHTTMEFSRRLFDRGIFVQGIRPPTVPKGRSRLRITVTAKHKKEDLEFVLETIAKIAKELKVV